MCVKCRGIAFSCSSPFGIGLAAIQQGFRLCGGDQRAFRSPSGLLRCPPKKYVGIPTSGSCQARFHKHVMISTLGSNQVYKEGAKESKGRPQSPLVASAEAKPPAAIKTKFIRRGAKECRGRPQSPLLASAEAKPSATRKHASNLPTPSFPL